MNKPTFNLFGEIVADDSAKWFDSDVVPAQLVGWLKKQSGADVEININSPGGDVAAGLAIANAIKAYEGKVTANVLGLAASMASVIACACDELKMGDGAFLMIHNPWTVTMGDADDLRHDAEVLDKMRDAVIGFYQSKTSKSADDLKALMDAESWLTFDELSDAGFAVARLDEEVKAAACATRRAFDRAPEAARRFYSTVPSDWLKRFSGLQAAKDKEIARFREVAESAAAAADKSAQDLAAANSALDASRAECEKLRADFSTISNDLDAKSQALDQAKAEVEQLAAKCAETEKALAETQASLEVAENRYRAQVGAAMQPAEDENRSKRDILAALPYAERAAYYEAHKAEIDG